MGVLPSIWQLLEQGPKSMRRISIRERLSKPSEY